MNIEYDQVRDEIEHFHNMRSFGSMQACHRIFSFELNGIFPAVFALRVHLPQENLVYFDQRVRNSHRNYWDQTELTQFFEFNRQNPEVKVSYVDFPKKFIWISKERRWKSRTRFVGTIGRVYNIHPREGDTFFLRMLLNSTLSAGWCNVSSYHNLLWV